MAAQRNIVLIGMPASGKSTVGRLLAERLRRPFVDTDTVLEQRHGVSLADLLQTCGLDGFVAREEQAVLELDVRGAVIATGGSVVYGERGMAALREHGTVVLIDCPLQVLARRLGDPAARGMVIAPGQTLEELLQERLPLYRRYADITVVCDAEPEVVVEEVIEALGEAG